MQSGISVRSKYKVNEISMSGECKISGIRMIGSLLVNLLTITLLAVRPLIQFEKEQSLKVNKEISRLAAAQCSKKRWMMSAISD